MGFLCRQSKNAASGKLSKSLIRMISPHLCLIWLRRHQQVWADLLDLGAAVMPRTRRLE